jgi:hypothetical protein
MCIDRCLTKDSINELLTKPAYLLRPARSYI